MNSKKRVFLAVSMLAALGLASCGIGNWGKKKSSSSVEEPSASTVVTVSSESSDVSEVESESEELSEDLSEESSEITEESSEESVESTEVLESSEELSEESSESSEESVESSAEVSSEDISEELSEESSVVEESSEELSSEESVESSEESSAEAQVADIELGAESLLGYAGSNIGYCDGTSEVGEKAFAWVECGAYGNGIQMRTKNSKSSSIWNTAAFDAPLKAIDITLNAGKQVYDNAHALYFTFGEAAEELGGEVAFDTVADQYTYHIDVAAENAYFFKLVHGITYSLYVDSIKLSF